MGLLRFHASESPILVGDEFLVNFTYTEANDVLKDIITFFINQELKKQKIAIFILHDLSFEFLKNLPSNYPVRVIVAEETDRSKNEDACSKEIVTHEMALKDFFAAKWKNPEEQKAFEKFGESYEPNALQKDDFVVSLSNDIFPFGIAAEKDPYGGKIYRNINLEVRKNRFIVLTGFSGCGKTTLCNQYADKITDKNLFRYFPSRALASLSNDSQISIKRDLSIMYAYLNQVDSIDECKTDLEKVLQDVKLFYEVDKFLDKKVYDLSGGELQRYWLARILFTKNDHCSHKGPELLILDESIASLDCITKNSLIGFLLHEVLSRRNMTILYVSHDLRDISVIYKTLLENLGSDNIKRVFEHYEMFHKKSTENSSEQESIYRVKTPFPEYRENLINRRPNTYISLKNNQEFDLRLKSAVLSQQITKGIENE
jgi:ABC-type dipeptide/oligopeptide/nickel transport system ATPase subunit